MINYIFSVYDVKTQLYSAPFYNIRKEAAIRDFAYVCNDPNCEFNRYPSDYALYILGTFDNETGNFDIYPHSEYLTVASNHINMMIPEVDES